MNELLLENAFTEMYQKGQLKLVDFLTKISKTNFTEANLKRYENLYKERMKNYRSVLEKME
jgi:hypothetical protein